MQINQYKTSIIILAYNQLEYTKKCIASIRKYTQIGTYELIAIDNASTDGTANWLKGQKDIKSIINAENLGFPKGCNQGIAISSGSEILLLNNDTIVTQRWLEQLLTALYSDENVGAVSCLTNNCSNHQSIKVDYKSVEEMQDFANSFNKTDKTKWESRLRLVGFCFLIKGSVAKELGGLDERFTPGMFEDDDYSLRIIKAGHRLLLCKDTFIHHFGSVSFKMNVNKTNQLMETNMAKFQNKWGLVYPYCCKVGYDLIDLMATQEKKINILEIGCAAGATLLKLRDLYPEAKLYGIEKKENLAEIANFFADVVAADVEQMEMPFSEGFFDFIIMGEVLEELYDPQAVMGKMQVYLKPGGAVIASVSNVMHWSVIKGLLAGQWPYRESKMLNTNPLRFFTLSELVKMFKETGYECGEIQSAAMTMSAEDKEKFLYLQRNGWITDMQHLDAYQWIIKANKISPVLSDESQSPVSKISQGELRELILLLRRMEQNILAEESGKQALSMIRQYQMAMPFVAELIENHMAEKAKVAVLLATLMYQNQMKQEMFSLLINAYKLYSTDAELVYTLAFFLDLEGNKESAVKILENFQAENQGIKALLAEIRR